MAMQRLGLIGGTGKEGRGLAKRLAHAGFDVVVGSRSRDRATEAVAEIRVEVPEARIAPAENDELFSLCPVLFLCVPFTNACETVIANRDRFSPQSLLIDITIPLEFRPGGVRLLDLPEGSATEQVRAELSTQVKLAATFKTIPAHVLGDLGINLDCDEFVCGDSPEARSQTLEILRQIPGLRPVDLGSLRMARALEWMTLTAVSLNRRHKSLQARFRVVGLHPNP